jgi:hypothetical protein
MQNEAKSQRTAQTEMFGAGVARSTRSEVRQNGHEPAAKTLRGAARGKGSGLALLDLHEPAVQEKLIEKATRGDMSALWLFFELQRRDRCVTLDIPKIETAEEALAANAVIIAAVASGQLTPAEGANIGSLISSQSKLLETVDQEKRIRALEEKKQ